MGQGNGKALIDTLDGGTWTETDLNPDNIAKLLSVSCPSATSCVAVGYSLNSQNNVETGVLARLSAGTWTSITAPEPISAGANEAAHLDGVSCGAAGSCIAIGAANNAEGYEYDLIETLSNGSWTGAVGPEPSSSVGYYSHLDHISCSSTAFCVATGFRENQTTSGPEGILAAYQNGSWSDVAAPLPAGATFALHLAAVDCPADGVCEAVGAAQGTSTASGLIEVRASNAWSSKLIDVPANSADPQFAELHAVDCPTTTTCVATGTFEHASGYVYPLIDTISNGIETAIQAPEPSDTGTEVDHNQNGSLDGVSCTSASACTTVGFYYITGYVQRGLIVSSGSSTAPTSPTVTGVLRKQGPVTGGTKVTISGTALTGVTGVHFGSAAASKVTVVSSTRVTAVTPKHSHGLVDVTVTTAGGTSAKVGADHYTYVAAPKISDVRPGHGSHKGGTRVTILGKNLSGSTKVRFGSDNATHINMVSDTKISATAPKHAKGTVDIIVTGPGGRSDTSKADHFKYK